MEAQICPACGGNQFIYKDTEKVCYFCGAVILVEVDLKAPVIIQSDSDIFEVIHALGMVTYLFALVCILVSFFDTTFILYEVLAFTISVGLYSIYEVNNWVNHKRSTNGILIVGGLINVALAALRVILSH